MRPIPIALALACSSGPEPAEEVSRDLPAAVAPAAVAALHPTGGSEVHGDVKLTDVEGGVRVKATVHGLKPGRHGFHVHEYGDCTGRTGVSTGPHLGSEGDLHGGPWSPPGERHLGDLGNLEAHEDGTAHYERVDRHLVMEEIIGRSVVVHLHMDDLETQPSGDSGPAVACGVVGIAEKPGRVAVARELKHPSDELHGSTQEHPEEALGADEEPPPEAKAPPPEEALSEAPPE